MHLVILNSKGYLFFYVVETHLEGSVSQNVDIGLRFFLLYVEDRFCKNLEK